MKKEEVPQFKSALSKANIKELNYATDENGKYSTALSEGWEPKALALKASLEEIEERIFYAKQEVLAHKKSPVSYYMEKSRMDVPTLAAYIEKWQWQVKLHFKPYFFNKLSQKNLQKYADVFEISIDELINIK